MRQKIIQAFLIMIAGIAIISFLLPLWCTIFWIVLVVVILKLNTKIAIWTGALSLSLVWLIAAVYFKMQDVTGLTDKTGDVLGGISGSILLLLTVVIAFISGLSAGWFGAAINKLIFGERQHSL